MDISRRKFFKISAAAGGMAACAGVRPAQAREAIVPDPNWYGMLNDSARCVGCTGCSESVFRATRSCSVDLAPPGMEPLTALAARV